MMEICLIERTLILHHGLNEVEWLASMIAAFHSVALPSGGKVVTSLQSFIKARLKY